MRGRAEVSCAFAPRPWFFGAGGQQGHPVNRQQVKVNLVLKIYSETKDKLKN
jgi:hypothetical protein